MSRIIALVLVTLTAHPLLALQGPGGAGEGRRQVRVTRSGDSLRATVTVVGFEREIEQLARELMATAEAQSAIQRTLAELSLRSRFDTASRAQIERLTRDFRARFAQASSKREALRSRLLELCDQTAKPQGYMGITFSATMRADTLRSGSEVFRFDEYPVVETVEPGSPADSAGVRTGDEIIRIGGREVRGEDIVFTRLLRPGNRLAMRVQREGETRDVIMRIGRRPPSLDGGCPWLDARIAVAVADGPLNLMVPSVAPRATTPRSATAERAPAAGAYSGRGVAIPPTPVVPATPSARAGPAGGTYVFTATSPVAVAGATVVRMNADLRQSFGVGNGVLVLDVARGTPAFASGLKGGDVITAVGRSTVTTPATILRAMQGASDREITLRVVRKKKAQSVTLRW